VVELLSFFNVDRLHASPTCQGDDQPLIMTCSTAGHPPNLTQPQGNRVKLFAILHWWENRLYMRIILVHVVWQAQNAG